MRHVVAAATAAALLAGCGGGPEPVALGDLPVLTALWPGTGPPERTEDAADRLVELRPLYGSFDKASVELATMVRAQGWQVTQVRCVGSGNDVIAVREVADGAWVLLEAGAGERGAGMILTRLDGPPTVPAEVPVEGDCPAALVAAVR